MQTTLIVNSKIRKNISRSALYLAAMVSGLGIFGTKSYAVDSDAATKEWSFDSSLSRSQLAEKAAKIQKEGHQKIVDIETYRIGRTEKVAAIWVETAEDEKWLYRDGMSISTLKTEHAEHIEDGYVINEIEVVRIGANLEFSAVWTKAEDQEETLFYWGMDDLLFSNRYGEMADRGYRLQDIEVYSGNGRTYYAAIWVEKKPGENVRFYRGLKERDFTEMALKMKDLGFRMIDIEGYYVDDNLLFAASWEQLGKGQEAHYETSLLVDVFYQKNAELTAKGYRLVDFDAYPKSVNEMRYAGCWVKQGEVEEDEDNKDAFIESFRISNK